MVQNKYEQKLRHKQDEINKQKQINKEQDHEGTDRDQNQGSHRDGSEAPVTVSEMGMKDDARKVTLPNFERLASIHFDFKRAECKKS